MSRRWRWKSSKSESRLGRDMSLCLPGSSLRLWYATDGRGTQRARGVPLRNIATSPEIEWRPIATLSVTIKEARKRAASLPCTIRREAGSMPVPISQAWTVATYVLKQKLQGRKRYPFVLLLEALFWGNLAWAGCGK